MEDNHRFRIVNAGRRFGKTVLAVEELIFAAVSSNEGNIAYVAPTYAQARDISWEILKKRVSNIKADINESRLEMRIPNKFGNHSRITLKGWESIESVRGLAFDLLVLDEVAMYRSFWLEWQEIIRPTLTDKKGKVIFISTPKGFNHFYDLYNFSDPDYKSFHFTSYDNPYLPVEELDKARKELPEDRFAQEYLADFRKQEGLVYKEFNRDLHLYEEEPTREIINHMAGVDFGYNNPCAVIPIDEDSDGHYWIPYEWYKTRRVEAQIADYVHSCGFNAVYPDPENPSAIEVLNQRGINVMEVVKGKGSVLSGIDAVKSLFKQNRIHIHKDCRSLIHELETYAYPEKKPDKNEADMPIKENDHALDALRYCLANHKSNVMSDTEYYLMLEAQRHGKNNYSR